MIDLATGTFKVRVTGRPRAGSGSAQHRRVVPPQASSTSSTSRTSRRPTRRQLDSERRRRAQTNCGDKYRTARATARLQRDPVPEGDKINGPLHTNDDSLDVRDADVRAQQRVDSIEVAARRPATPQLGVQRRPERSPRSTARAARRKPLGMPQSNNQARRPWPTRAARSTPARPSSGSTARTTNDMAVTKRWQRRQPADHARLPANGVHLRRQPQRRLRQAESRRRTRRTGRPRPAATCT